MRSRQGSAQKGDYSLRNTPVPRSFVKIRLVRSTGHLSGGDGLKPERRGRSVDLQAQASRIRLADQPIFERRLLRRRALHPYSGVLAQLVVYFMADPVAGLRRRSEGCLSNGACHDRHEEDRVRGHRQRG
jgi:hypothetical protein